MLTVKAPLKRVSTITPENSIKIAGNKLDLDIIEYVKKTYGIIIGEGEAEEVKKHADGFSHPYFFKHVFFVFSITFL